MWLHRRGRLFDSALRLEPIIEFLVVNFFRGVRVTLNNLTLLLYRAYENGREETLIRHVSGWLLAPEPDPLSQSITVDRDDFSFWCVLLESVYVTPHPTGYGDTTATYIRRVKIPSHTYVKHNNTVRNQRIEAQ